MFARKVRKFTKDTNVCNHSNRAKNTIFHAKKTPKYIADFKINKKNSRHVLGTL